MLAAFDIDEFLRVYWQKRPLLIRNPWDEWNDPLEPDELAGLACEKEVESRLIVQRGDDDGDGWMVEHGPLPEERFGQLGKDPWTLLVQSVDHHVPSVAELLAEFRFVPNWRVDDVMVSYANAGGGVGPHFDQYDVFLVQGLGKRRWQLGALCDENTELLPHEDLRLLADFESSEEWVLEPGDILYIPPGIAHNGVAVSDDCMTYSIGFRTPSRGELISHWADNVLDGISEDDRYTDPAPSVPTNPGELTPAAIEELHAMVTEKMADRDAFAKWFGQYSTAPKSSDIEWRPEMPVDVETLRLELGREVALLRNPASRFAFNRADEGQVSLFVDGRCWNCDGEAAAFAELICAQDRVTCSPMILESEDAMALILQLVNEGLLALDPDA